MHKGCGVGGEEAAAHSQPSHPLTRHHRPASATPPLVPVRMAAPPSPTPPPGACLASTPPTHPPGCLPEVPAPHPSGTRWVVAQHPDPRTWSSASSRLATCTKNLKRKEATSARRYSTCARGSV